MFASQIGRNLEIYVDDMAIKTLEDRNHVGDLEETFKSVWKFNIRLSLDKCTFGVPAGNLLSFMLTHKGVEESPDKC